MPIYQYPQMVMILAVMFLTMRAVGISVVSAMANGSGSVASAVSAEWLIGSGVVVVFQVR